MVANEIKTLADRVKLSTKEISQILKTVNEQTLVTAKTSEEVYLIVKREGKAVQVTENILNCITGIIEEVSNKIYVVKESVMKMVDQKENVISCIESTAAVAQQTSACIEEVTTSTCEQVEIMKNLEDITNKLNHSVTSMDSIMKNFKISL